MFIAMAMAVAGCPDERASVDMMEPAGAAAAPSSRALSAPMEVDVASVQTEAGVDTKAVRTVLRDAEPAFLACLDPDGSTGVLAVKLSLEGDGSVGEIGALPTTTYGSDDARACLERILAVLRFPTAQSRERFELTISLEVRTRHEGAENPTP
jgi:hypothetical protein